MEKEQLKTILEAVLMAASSPLAVDALLNIFMGDQRPERGELEAALEEMIGECDARSYELKKVSSGYRFQVKKDYADYVSRLWEDKPARYSRALLETLALIAYRQPLTRGEIEAVRGVSVSSHIIKTLDERNWIKVVGHRDVPGKPALYATTKEFLDYFNLENLDDLPSLQEIRDIDAINAELDLRLPDDQTAKTEQAESENNTSSDAQAAGADETVTNLATTDEFEDDETVSEADSADAQLDEHLDAASDNDTVISLAMADETEDDADDETSSSASSAGDQDDEHLDAAPASAEH